MVEAKEGVIFVSASPPGHDKPAALKFVLAEHSQGEEQLEVSPETTVWGILSSQSCWSLCRTLKITTLGIE